MFLADSWELAQKSVSQKLLQLELGCANFFHVAIIVTACFRKAALSSAGGAGNDSMEQGAGVLGR
jgi:hypothetical protein